MYRLKDILTQLDLKTPPKGFLGMFGEGAVRMFNDSQQHRGKYVTKEVLLCLFCSCHRSKKCVEWVTELFGESFDNFLKSSGTKRPGTNIQQRTKRRKLDENQENLPLGKKVFCFILFYLFLNFFFISFFFFFSFPPFL